jgi:hypothetical protein
MEHPKHIAVEVESDYLIACARIRNISTTKLVHKLMKAIAQDQLVLAVLDDEEQYGERERYQHRFRI